MTNDAGNPCVSSLKDAFNVPAEERETKNPNNEIECKKYSGATQIVVLPGQENDKKRGAKAGSAPLFFRMES